MNWWGRLFVVNLVVFFGWIGGFGTVLLPDYWRGGVTGLLVAIGLVSFMASRGAGEEEE